MNTKRSLSSSSSSNSSINSELDDQANTSSKDVRIAVVGQAGVGKSALIVRFITGRFLHLYNPTLEDKYYKSMKVDGENYRLCILDTAGEDDRHITYYFSFSHILLLLFSLNDRSSLARAQQIRHKADSHWHGSRRISAVLVGCKGDTIREVTTSEALTVAKELDCCYVETSAAEGYNCTLPFKTAVKMYSHMYRSTDTYDNNDHTSHNKRSSGILSKCKTLLSPMSQLRRDLRESSPARVSTKNYSTVVVDSSAGSVLSKQDNTSTLMNTSAIIDPITITVSMER